MFKPSSGALGLAALSYALLSCTGTSDGSGGPGSSVPDAPLATPTRHEVVADDGHPLTVWEKRASGEARGAVLLLHGRTWSSLPDFDLGVEGEELSLMDGLTDAGFAVYALDARGYGATLRDDTGWLEPTRMAEDAALVLAWITGREPALSAPPALFGWSFGSTVAHLTAQRYPERVAGVVLFGYWKDPERLLPATETPDEPPRVPTTEAAAASDFITPGTISDAAVQAYVVQALAADPVRADIAHVEQFNELDPGLLTVPVQVLQGELDPIAPAAVQARLFDGLATGDREWVVLGGCDHAAFLESCRPRFLRALVGFLEEVTGS
jgi:pimeloyl-ACP methyl ester carboxylesterase